jgi:hypothetical protein
MLGRIVGKGQSQSVRQIGGYSRFAYFPWFFPDRNIGIGVFPEGEEIFVGGERPYAGGIRALALQGYRLQDVRTSHSQMRQGSLQQFQTMLLCSRIL